jgi:peptide chain release factor 3
LPGRFSWRDGVKARGERRRARSDRMAVERERGISVSSAVTSFEHEGLAFNLLDTPGHQVSARAPIHSG